MSDRYETFVTGLMEHVVATAPDPQEWPGQPPMPQAPPPRSAPWVVAAGAFLAVLAVGALTVLSVRGGNEDVASEPDAVVITLPDGVDLHGELWAGSEVGVLVVGAYGAVEGELDPIIAPLAARGFTVLTHDLRGQGASQGAVHPELLDEDLAAVVAFLRARSDRVYVVGYRHAGAAALAAAGTGALDVDGLAGVFAMERYLEQDALAALPRVEVPLLLIGATNPMARAAPEGTVFGSVAGPEIFTHSGGLIADQVAQFVADTEK